MQVPLGKFDVSPSVHSASLRVPSLEGDPRGKWVLITEDEKLNNVSIMPDSPCVFPGHSPAAPVRAVTREGDGVDVSCDVKSAGPSRFLLTRGSGILGVPTGATGRGAGGILPGRLMTTVSVHHVYRFSVSTTGTYQITVASLLGALGGITSIVNSKIISWASAVKIRKVTVWPSASSSAPVNVQLSWSAGQSGQVPDQAEDMSIPQGTTVSRALAFVPPPMTLAKFWIGDADVAANLFQVQVAAGSILDLDVDYRLSNIITPTFSTVTVATLGTVYYLALDGPGSNKIVPVGLPTTA